MHIDGIRIAFFVTAVFLILTLTALIVSCLICQRGRKKRKQKDIGISEIKPKTTVNPKQDNVPEEMELIAKDSICLPANKDQIETKLVEVKGQMHATKQKLRDMHDKYSALQQERANKEDECETLKKHNDKLKEANEPLLSRLKEAPMELNQLELAKQVEIQEIQNKLSAANASNDELKNDIARLTYQLTMINQEKTQLLPAVGGREVNIGELLEKQTKLENDRTLAREELSKAKAEQQKDKDAAKAQVVKLLLKTKQLESELQIYQTEAKQNDQKVKELERQNEELSSQVTSMKTEVDQMNEARNQIQQKEEFAQNQLKRLQDAEVQFQTLQKQLENPNMYISNMKTENERLTRELAETLARAKASDQSYLARIHDLNFKLQRRDQMIEVYQEKIYQGGQQNARPEECNTDEHMDTSQQ